jgi:2-phosphosulfolactate phosphatase
MDLWMLAKNDLSAYIDKVAQRTRLKNKGLDDCIEFCLTADYNKTIPVLKNGILVDKSL